MRTNNNSSRSYRQQTHYITNERINATEMRIIDDQGKQVDVLPRSEALRLAQEKELDLVLVAAQAQPPVVKLIDFKKFLYQEQKKLQEAKKGSKKSVIKDIKLSLFIGKGDLDRFISKSQDYIKEGHQVRINLLLKGRELGKKQMAFDLVNEFIKSVGDVNVSTVPKVQGKIILAVISKKK